MFSPPGWLLTDYVSRPWSGRLAHSDKTAHYTVLVIHADRTRPVSPAARAVRTAAGSRCLDFGQFFLFKNKSKNEFAFYLLRIMLPVA